MNVFVCGTSRHNLRSMSLATITLITVNAFWKLEGKEGGGKRVTGAFEHPAHTL